MTTVTLPREVAQQALDALEYHTEQTRPISKTEKAIAQLRAALDATAQPVDCRGCTHFHYSGQFCLLMYLEPATHCTNFDKFQALPPIVLTKLTKQEK